MSTIGVADFRQKASHLRQQTTAAIRSQCISEVRERIAQAAEGTLHGTQLVHDSGDSADRIAHLTDTLTQTFQKIRVEGITEAADRIAQRTGLIA